MANYPNLPTIPTLPSSIREYAPGSMTTTTPLLPVIISALVFPLPLMLSQTLQSSRLLQISTATPVLPTIFGVVAVGLGGCGVNYVAKNWCYNSRIPYLERNFTSQQTAAHYTRIILLSLISFKLLGGRFHSLSPSSYISLGAFARRSVPATEAYATGAERKLIQQIGRSTGCHTCGRAGRGVKFNADHMPPLSIVKRENKKFLRKYILPKMKQAFYPQCESCSNVQGGLLSKVMKGQGGKGMDTKGVYKVLRGAKSNGIPFNHSYNHALRPRLSYLSGGTVSFMTVNGCQKDGDYTELRNFEKKLQKQVGTIWESVMRSFEK